MLPEEASVDHVIPQKFNKKAWPNNDPVPLRAAHKLCNSIRGHDLTDRPPYYYHEERLKIEEKLKHRNKKKNKAKKVVAPRFQIKHDDKGESFVDMTERIFRR